MMRLTAETSGYRSKILVVEDDREIRLAWEAALEGDGHLVRAAIDGDEGLKAFLEFDPDLALLDLKMPGMSGAELCGRIRESSNIPVIILSAVDNESEKAGALEAGADDYLVKGVSINEVLSRVTSSLRIERTRRWSPEFARRSRDSVMPVLPNQRSGHTLIIAEADKNEQRKLINVVEGNGHTGYAVERGEDALALAEAKKPDVMVVSLSLDGMSGKRLLRELKLRSLTETIPVIVTTESGSPRERVLARVSGAIDYVIKPWDEEEIEFRIGIALLALGA